MSNSSRLSSRLSEVRSPADLLLLLQVALFAIALRILTRLPLERLGELLEPPRDRPAADPGRERHLMSLVDLTLDLGRRVLRPDCLMRGLTRYYVLRRAGVDVALVFGLGQPTGAVAGHCWLVKEGEPYLEARDPRPLFTETCRLRAGTLRTKAEC